MKLLQKLDSTPSVRRMVWAILLILFIYAIGHLGHLGNLAPLIMALKG